METEEQNNINSGEPSGEHIQYTPPQQNQSPMSGMPGLPGVGMPRSPFGLIKLVIFGFFAFVCFFGIINVVMQFFSPQKFAQTAQTSTSSGTTSNTAPAPAAATWKTFTNAKYKYSVSYPTYLNPNDETPYSTVFLGKKQIPNKLQFPTLYVSVIPDGLTDAKLVYNYMPADILQKMYAANIGDVIQTQDGFGAEYFTFKKLAVFPVDGINAVTVENDKVLDGEGIANRRIILKKDNLTYIIGSFFGTQEELDTFRKFVESFKLN